MNITKNEILSGYNLLKKAAQENYNNTNIDKSLELIEACAKIAYNSNFFYVDDELELLLKNIANSIGSYNNITAIKGRLVFIDTNGSDNHGLTQQYIRAFIAADIEFAYVYEDTDLNRIKIILEELKAYPKATIYTFDKIYPFTERIRKILDFVREYKPQSYLMHIMPWDVTAVAICNLLKGVTRYNINATDHAFWLGASCIDYCIEFRDYGYTVSYEKRGLEKSQLLFLPYYPIINNLPFQGFPVSLPAGKIKIFSGGNFYKTYGERGFYFEVVKQLLQQNPEAVLFFAGSGNSDIMKKFIRTNNFQDRIYLLGNRGDIYQVFEASDIYLSTYPITGALMGQYAAISGKAILSYSDKKLPINFLEGIICHQYEVPITFTDLNDFFKYAQKLCNDKSFRNEQGDELKKCVITPSIFNEELEFLLAESKSKRISKLEVIDYESFASLYLEVENNFLPSSQKIIASKLKLKTLYKFPRIFINIAFLVIGNALQKNK